MLSQYTLSNKRSILKMNFSHLLCSVLLIFAFTNAFGLHVNASSVEWLDEDISELSAHRAAHVVAPENSAEAIKQAGLLDYGFVEIDIQETKDNHYVLMHDSTIDRTTTGTGEVEDLTLKEIKSESMINENEKETNYDVPTLKEALETAEEYNVGVNFDGSKGDWDDKDFVDGIMSEVEEENLLNQSFFVLSDQDIRDQFNDWYPKATVTFLGDASKDLDEDIKELKKYDNSLYTTSIHNIDKEAAEKIEEEDLALHVYQVNSAEQYSKAKKLEPEPRIIETDVLVPDGTTKLKAVVDRLHEEKGIEKNSVTHDLKMHLTSIEHFEDEGDAQKVVKHTKGLKKLLKHKKNEKDISDWAYETLNMNANKIINEWEN